MTGSGRGGGQGFAVDSARPAGAAGAWLAICERAAAGDAPAGSGPGPGALQKEGRVSHWSLRFHSRFCWHDWSFCLILVNSFLLAPRRLPGALSRVASGRDAEASHCAAGAPGCLQRLRALSWRSRCFRLLSHPVSWESRLPIAVPRGTGAGRGHGRASARGRQRPMWHPGRELRSRKGSRLYDPCAWREPP